MTKHLAISPLRYMAFVRKEGKHHLIEFPDAPGCQTFASRKAGIHATAQEAIEGWLEAYLVSGQVPPWPRTHRAPRHGEERIQVAIEPRLALAVQFRRMRAEQGWTQRDVAERVGVSQQQIAKLEDPDANPTIDTVTKVAKAFDMNLIVSFEKAG
jgi:DNA-binding XRE family transcriptional regulator/predicted RNase H-like HicB family nuclease